MGLCITSAPSTGLSTNGNIAQIFFFLLMLKTKRISNVFMSRPITFPFPPLIGGI